jgi:uncharacterized SAM-binding protein YcdF (DUF218 family)
MRLVAVLGYSARRPNGLHRLCAERLHHAEDIADDSDTILLSGWGRRGNVAEAELMHAAWQGKDVRLLADGTARSTRENALNVADVARRLDAREVTVVTSRWHAFRAGMLVRAALPSIAVRTSSPPGRPPVSLLVRELGCLVALPLQLIRVRAQA